MKAEPISLRLPGTTVARLATDALWMFSPILTKLTKADEWVDPRAGTVEADLGLAGQWVQMALDGPGMETCRAAGAELYQRIEKALEFCKRAPSPGHSSHGLEIHLGAVAGSARRLDAVIRDRLKRLDAFVPDVTGLLANERLVANAHECVDESVRGLLDNDARSNLDHAGRALVFDLPTASAFHTSRAVESVVRSFFLSTNESASSFPSDPRNQNLGAYCSLLTQRLLGQNFPWSARKFDDDPRKMAAAEVLANLWTLKNGYRDVVTHTTNEWYETEKASRYFMMSVASISDLLHEQCERKWSAVAP